MSLRSQNGKPLSNICTGERKREMELEDEEEKEDEEKDGGCRRCVYRYLGVVGTKGVVVWG